MIIHLRIESAVILPSPVTEGRKFIIDEKASVADRGLPAHHIVLISDMYTFLGCRDDISKPHPGTDLHKLGKMEKSVYGSSLVASCDNDAGYALYLSHGKKIYLSLSADSGEVDDTPLLKIVYYPRPSDTSGKYHSLCKFTSGKCTLI